MVIVVVATASKVGGALSIYRQILSHIEVEKRDNRYYILIDPCMPQKEMAGVSYMSIDTNGLKRIIYDIYGYKRELLKRDIQPDIIFSLQNTAVRCGDVPQLVYYHQSLPFFQYKFNILTSAGRTYFFYHYLYPLYVKLLHNGNVKYIVQTDYMKECFSKKFSSVSSNDVYSFFPDVENVEKDEVADYDYKEGSYNFVFPALAADYKEHETLVYALKKLEEKEKTICEKIRIHLTFEKDSYPHLASLIKKSHLEKNFVFHGRVEHGVMLSMVKCSRGLLFPSVIETIGLPMLEAAALGVPVVANDLPFVHSVIDNYTGVSFMDLHNYDQWSQRILSLCYRYERFPELRKNSSTWPKVFNLISTLGNRNKE